MKQISHNSIIITLFCCLCFVSITDDKAQREPRGASAPEPPGGDGGGAARAPGRWGSASGGHHQAGATRPAGAAGGGAAQGAGEAGRAGTAFQTGK